MLWTNRHARNAKFRAYTGVFTSFLVNLREARKGIGVMGPAVLSVLTECAILRYR